MNEKIGPYKVSDIRFVAAFDIDERKVGKDLSEAVCAEPNNTRKIVQLRPIGVKVQMAQPLDGISPIAGDKIQPSNAKPSNITKVLEDTKTDVVVNLTPTGASKASDMYAQAALQAGRAFINATPAKIASNKAWQAKYKKKGALVVGDDIMDQIGSTILHKNLLSLLVNRGTQIGETYQLDIGGGTESQLALDKKRYEIKRGIKTAAVAAAPLRLNADLGLYTNFANLLDLAAIALPAGFRKDGLPFGCSLIAPAFADRALLDLGTRCQELAGLPLSARAPWSAAPA